VTVDKGRLVVDEIEAPGAIDVPDVGAFATFYVDRIRLAEDRCPAVSAR
jgi:hypothetical protein